MPDFSRIIRLAYLRILDREPDPGGLASYNANMNGGLSEAAMRESLLRSPEYAEKNPARPAVGAATRGQKARTGSGRPAPTRKKARSRHAR